MPLALLVLLASVLTGCGHTARELTPTIEKHTLGNGLDVYLLQDKSAPIFTFQYWVKVGSGDEWEGTPGITGLSHFFEHMMFRGTKKYPGYFDEISKRGGKLNAFTWLDETVYWEKLAASDLEFVMDVESDRLRNMTIDFLNLEPEREVVKSERLMRTENSPSGSLRESISATLFTDHSYHWPTVGWMRDLNAITIEQAQEYFARYYVPNNAYVILVGDFEPSNAMELLQKYYGGFEKRAVERTPRRLDPDPESERRTRVEKPTGTDLFIASYRTPAGGHPDFVALEVIDQVLTGGKTSRLQKALVHGEAPIARSVGGFAFPFVDPGVLSVEVNMLPGHSGRTGEKVMTREIERLITEPVPADELQRAVAQLRGSVVRSMSTTHSRAQMMGFAIRATGDATLPWKRLKQYGEISAEDIQRVAAKYLKRSNRAVGHAVDSRKMLPLAKARLARSASKVEDLDAVVLDSLELATRQAAAGREETSIVLEETAIRLLNERADAERKRLGADAAKIAELDKYLKEGEKGPVKRLAKVTERRQVLKTLREELATSSDTLGKRLDTVTHAAGKAPATSDRRRLEWARALTSTAAPGQVVVPGPNDDMGIWALYALSARDLRGAKAPDIMVFLNKAETKDKTLGAIIDYAHAWQQIQAGRM
ncbi:MAG: zinc protease [Myxococcota bacterium]|jgi:zinc protease